MKKTKRIVSVLLCTALLVSVVTVAPFSANAADRKASIQDNTAYESNVEFVTETTSVTDSNENQEEFAVDNEDVASKKESTENIVAESNKSDEAVGVSEEYTADNFIYTLNDNKEASIINYTGRATSLYIPSSIDGHSVISINNSAFKNNERLESVCLGESIIEIGNEAFSNCQNLSTIQLPRSVEKLGYKIISNTSIEEITIPKTVKTSQYSYGVVSADAGYYYYYGALGECPSLKKITFENGTTSIPNYICAAGYKGNYTGVEQIDIPNTVTRIGERAFLNCAFLQEIELSENIESIGTYAFGGCENLTKLKMSNASHTQKIGDYAFSYCEKLNDIVFSDSVSEIGNGAFSNCQNLSTIQLPRSVEKLGYKIISNTSIEEITIPKTVKTSQYSYGVVSADAGYYYYYGALGECPSLKKITFENGTTSIPNYICAAGYKGNYAGVEQIDIPNTVTRIGERAFLNCAFLQEIELSENIESIGTYAFGGCSTISKIIIKNDKMIFENKAIYVCPVLTIYGYENSSAENYAIDNSIPFVAIADEDTFIQKHLDFIGAENSNNTYHNQLQHFDLAEIALEDYGDLNDTYNLWRTIRGEIFDNPYYTVLADMILSESAAQGQIESFDIHLDSEWRSVANDIIELINSKVDLTPSQESKIKKMFKKGDFTDETTFKFCQNILGNKVSKDELNSIFNVYDKTNTFLDVFNQGADIVESVYDTMNYSAILKAYEKTSDEFKVVLMQMAYTCQTENPWLYTAIDKYLKSDYDTEMRNKIVEEVAKNGLSIGKTLFKSSIENKVKAFIINNMDLNKIGTSVATKVLAFVEGCKIGYAIGTGIDNLLFSTDDVSNSFVAASATAKTAGYLKYVLETNESNLRNNPTIKNAVLFCETYNMYKNIQLNTADTMIKYFSKNQTSLINRIFQSNNVLYEHQIYNWQILKLNWQNASCHKGYILNSKLKNITVACPVDVTVYTNTGEIALQITDSVVEKNNGDVIATVCNNIKYITLPDDSYRIKITATESGTMTYSITDYNSFDNFSKTICFNNIPITKDNEYTGNIASGSDYSQSDISLYSNNATVESEVSEFTNESIIEVNSINLSSNNLSLKAEETKTLSAIVEPNNASIKTVSWYSDDSKIAQVDEYGNVSGISAGTTKIYCVSLEGKVVTECEVKVESKYDIGDTNLDGSITISDVTEIQKHLAELIHFSDEQQILADTNGDGIINITDATHLQKYLAEFDGVVLGKQSA